MVDNNINFALKTNNVYVHYGSKLAFDNVSFVFLKNELPSLMAPQGWGSPIFLGCFILIISLVIQN